MLYACVMQTAHVYYGCSFIFIISDNLTARYKLQFVSFSRQMTRQVTRQEQFENFCTAVPDPMTLF